MTPRAEVIFRLLSVATWLHIKMRLLKTINKFSFNLRVRRGRLKAIARPRIAKVNQSFNVLKMSTEIRNWDVVAKAMEAAGATSSQMYIRAKALAQGKLDPMPTSSPEAPYSISAVAG